MRLIDADDIVYESIDSTDTLREERYYGTGILAVRKEDIEAMPTIAHPKRKTGKWVELSHGVLFHIYKCDQCGSTIDVNGINVERGNANFCPNCGARMVKEDEEHD